MGTDGWGRGITRPGSCVAAQHAPRLREAARQPVFLPEFWSRPCFTTRASTSIPRLNGSGSASPPTSAIRTPGFRRLPFSARPRGCSPVAPVGPSAGASATRRTSPSERRRRRQGGSRPRCAGSNGSDSRTPTPGTGRSSIRSSPPGSGRTTAARPVGSAGVWGVRAWLLRSKPIGVAHGLRVTLMPCSDRCGHHEPDHHGGRRDPQTGTNAGARRKHFGERGPSEIPGIVCRNDTAQAPCAGKPASPVTDHPGRTRRREMDPRRVA